MYRCEILSCFAFRCGYFYDWASASPVALTHQQQSDLRSAILHAYSEEMKAGHYYNAIAARPNSPHLLRIFDCVKDQCLLVIKAEPGWSESLYQLGLKDGKFVNMRPLNQYGTAVRVAFFMDAGGSCFYVESHTRMGTKAQELIKLVGDGSENVTAKIVSGNRVISTRGDQRALRTATAQRPIVRSLYF